MSGLYSGHLCSLADIYMETGWQLDFSSHSVPNELVVGSTQQLVQVKQYSEDCVRENMLLYCKAGLYTVHL